MRTSRRDLEQLANIITHGLECRPGVPCTSLPGEREYRVEYAYGRPRLERADGSVDVSPRLPAGELAMWMRAFIAGMDAMREALRG